MLFVSHTNVMCNKMISPERIFVEFFVLVFSLFSFIVLEVEVEHCSLLVLHTDLRFAHCSLNVCV